MPEALVGRGGDRDPLAIRINGPDPTFRLATEVIEAKALRALDPVALDLLEIAATVFAADGETPRGGPTRPRMGAGWYRNFDFTIPVRAPELWWRADVSEALVESVETLTGDSVRFQFTEAAPDPMAQPYFDFNPAGATFKADEVILFSGGLDSFAGALEVLASTSARVILVTHRSAQKAIPRQVSLGRYLADRFKGRVLHVQVLARRAGDEARDSTQRSRTFLFSALGQAVAHAFGARRVSLFENGVVSHNLPISPQIVGTMATRTTHPLALRCIDRLMRLTLPSAPRIHNRYQWSTKSEVVSRIGEFGGSAQIRRAVSCTSIREQDSLHTHCGACTQCLDRRFALLHAGLAEHDPEEIYATDILFGERSSDRSITMAVEWTRHALRLGEIDELDFMNRYGAEAARIFRGHPELERRTALGLTLDMQRRQSHVVRSVLEKALHEKAGDIIARRLPPTSLIMLHLGQDVVSVDRLAEDMARRNQRAPIGDVDEVDCVPEPGAPLHVSFSMTGDRHMVDVIGLSTLAGLPARVPHALKPILDEDRLNCLAPTDHRYVIGTTLPALADMSKESIRKSVERCRKQLAHEYKRLHGRSPEDHLLVQNRPSRGYRLDPDIVIAPTNLTA